MRLHLADALLEQTRLALAQRGTARAREVYDEARGIIEETGYHRRDAEVSEIMASGE
jgi:hypothetical protein